MLENHHALKSVVFKILDIIWAIIIVGNNLFLIKVIRQQIEEGHSFDVIYCNKIKNGLYVEDLKILLRRNVFIVA